MFTLQWGSFEVAADAAIDWQAGTERAEAKLAGASRGTSF
jgi:hypothetical protein